MPAAAPVLPAVTASEEVAHGRGPALAGALADAVAAGGAGAVAAGGAGAGAGGRLAVGAGAAVAVALGGLLGAAVWLLGAVGPVAEVADELGVTSAVADAPGAALDDVPLHPASSSGTAARAVSADRGTRASCAVRDAGTARSARATRILRTHKIFGAERLPQQPLAPEDLVSGCSVCSIMSRFCGGRVALGYAPRPISR